MQPTEASEQIFVIVIDETYPPEDEENWEQEREHYRLNLEEQYRVSFDDADVGPGADIPAFLTVIATTDIPLWSALLAGFFFGKSINENLDAWGEIGRKIKGFFDRPVVLARHGAAVLAVGAVFEEMGGTPTSVKLLSYRVGHIGDSDDLTDVAASNEIRENTPTLNLGYVRHIFEIEADGLRFRVGIEGKDTKVIRLL